MAVTIDENELGLIRDKLKLQVPLQIFQNGSSQAVRLPKAFRIPGNEVKIFKKGNQVILEPIETTWDSLFESLSEFPEDFMKDGRNQPAMQKRESF